MVRVVVVVVERKILPTRSTILTPTHIPVPMVLALILVGAPTLRRLFLVVVMAVALTRPVSVFVSVSVRSVPHPHVEAVG